MKNIWLASEFKWL